jgi:hypothetical protein
MCLGNTKKERLILTVQIKKKVHEKMCRLNEVFNNGE